MSRVLFAGGDVFSRGSVGRADVVIDDGQLVDVGTDLDGDEVVDVTGCTLLPGLFDCHVHFAISTLDVVRRLETPYSYSLFQTAANLRRTLGCGITTARDAGGADLGVKLALHDGLINGPRLHVALSIISQTGGHGDAWMPCGLDVRLRPHPSLPDPIVNGPEEMRKKVRELVRNGADVLKVATSGGVLSPRSHPADAHFRADELEMLVAEATAAHRPVMAHALGTEGVKAAIRAGVRSIEHGVFLDEEAVSMMVELGTWLVPTLLAPRGVLAAVKAGAALPAAVVAKCEDLVEAHSQSFAMALAAGVRIAMGTDCPTSPHGTNLTELELMVGLGMPPARALSAATSAAAALLGLENELGSLEPGKRADIVVVEGDGLDVEGLHDRIRQVWKDGRRVVDCPVED